MSLYTFATANFITSDDYKRRPAMDIGMMARTMLLCLACTTALATLYAGGTDLRATTVSVTARR